MSLDPKDYTGMYGEPGKFEGESNATCYYWEMILCGHADDVYDEDGTLYGMLTVSEHEAAAFGADAGLKVGDTVLVTENDQGFVSMLAYATYEAAKADLQLTE